MGKLRPGEDEASRLGHGAVHPTLAPSSVVDAEPLGSSLEKMTTPQ